MLINIPSESESSDETVISSRPIDEEEAIQSPGVQQPQQKPEIDPMGRTCNQHIRGDGHATIPTPGSHDVPNLAQRTLVSLGPQQVVLTPYREPRNLSEKKPGEASGPPTMQWTKRKATTAPYE